MVVFFFSLFFVCLGFPVVFDRVSANLVMFVPCLCEVVLSLGLLLV